LIANATNTNTSLGKSEPRIEAHYGKHSVTELFAGKKENQIGCNFECFASMLGFFIQYRPELLAPLYTPSS